MLKYACINKIATQITSENNVGNDFDLKCKKEEWNDCRALIKNDILISSTIYAEIELLLDRKMNP